MGCLKSKHKSKTDSEIDISYYKTESTIRKEPQQNCSNNLDKYTSKTQPEQLEKCRIEENKRKENLTTQVLLECKENAVNFTKDVEKRLDNNVTKAVVEISEKITPCKNISDNTDCFKIFDNKSTTNLINQQPTSTNLNINLRKNNTQNIKKKNKTKIIKTDLHKTVIKHCYEWDPMPSNKEFVYVSLEDNNHEYIDVKQAFLDTTKRNLVNILSIDRIQNPYLLGRYLLKRQEMIKLHKRSVEEYMFHGTKSINVDSICRENFDWRLHGSEIGHRFGRGVSFSPISHYASHYCDKINTKVMLVAKVLIAETCIGTKDMIIPPYINKRRKLRYNASEKATGDVLVMYSDDEYYPAYKITFKVKRNFHK